MRSAALASTSAAISTSAERLGDSRDLFNQILLIAPIFLTPDLAPSWHTVSEGPIGPYGWIMSAAYIVPALTSAGLRASHFLRTCCGS
jgi:hypothetical protein